jgi:hypothetical protein
MNANKIAEELENINWVQGDGTVKPFQHYANFVRQQQAEIDALKKFKAGSDALDKKLHESMLKANEVWGKATKSILKKAKK